MYSKKINLPKNKILVIFLFLLIIAALVFIFLTQEQKPDPASEKIFREAAAKQLNKDPNELTDEDFAKITKLTIWGLEYYGRPDENPYKLSNIKPLEKFTNLQELYLSGIVFPQKDIPRWMKILAKFGILDLDERFTIDLSPLAKLRNLERLEISYSPIKNIKPLKGLTNLRKLRLMFTYVCDIKPISHLENLQDLNLGRTHVSNIKPIKGLKKLQELWLYGTPVSDLEPLKGLINLETLGLKDCKNIKEEQVEDLEKALPELEISRGK